MIKYIIAALLLCCIQANAQQATNAFTASCPALGSNGLLPKLYTCDSSAISPPVVWSNIPKGTQSFAITMHHYPKDGGKHVYLVVYHIPANQLSLLQGEKQAGYWGCNTQNKNLEYSPPCSKGPGVKEYIITVYAISRQPRFTKGTAVTMDELLAEIKDCTLASSALTVKYAR